MLTRPLTRDEFRRLVIPAFRSVFQEADAFGAPLRPDIPERLILFPISYRLESAADAIAGAAAVAGDDGFYVVETEAHWRELLGEAPTSLPLGLPKEMTDGLPPELQRATWAAANRPAEYSNNEAWWFSLSDLAPAKGPSPFGPSLETAVVSPTGRWGILISHEGHAVVGGSTAFVETLVERLSESSDQGGESIPVRDQVGVFLREVRDGWRDPMAWLPAHLSHVYGKERADASAPRVRLRSIASILGWASVPQCTLTTFSDDPPLSDRGREEARLGWFDGHGPGAPNGLWCKSSLRGGWLGQPGRDGRRSR